MNMIGHQHVGMNGAVAIASRFFEPMEIAVIILIGKEAWLAIDPALYNVQRNFGQLETGTAGHD
jgi:hypothetical protein